MSIVIAVVVALITTAWGGLAVSANYMSDAPSAQSAATWSIFAIGYSISVVIGASHWLGW